MRLPSLSVPSRSVVAVAVASASLSLAAALGACAAPASAAVAPCFDQLPNLAGIPPWGFHTSAPLMTDHGSYARAYGSINLQTNRISGTICQVRYIHAQQGLIVMKTLSPIIFHTHVAEMWGYPGNEVKAHVKVSSSTDASCKIGTVGVMTMYASYNGVRSDSVRFTFPAACRSHDHIYHGSQVNAQVPPL